MRNQPPATTGLPGLDAVLSGIEPGDNIVWEVDAIADYQEFVSPYVAAAQAAGRHLVYFRFADHPPLLARGSSTEQHDLDPARGFEAFVRDVHAVIEAAGRGTLYVFDCLSHLADMWGSDQSLGNFFQLTCPRLLDLETVTYFGIYRDRHSAYAVEPIRGTTQFMLDVFRLDGRLYIRPVKVQYRSREVMNTLHVRSGEQFRPVKESAVLAPILSHTNGRACRATSAAATGGGCSARPRRWPRKTARAAARRSDWKKRCGGSVGRCGCIGPASPGWPNASSNSKTTWPSATA